MRSQEITQAPTNLYEAFIRSVERFGVVTTGSVAVLIAFGWAVFIVYQDQKTVNEARWTDNKAHQIELMTYLTNRNEAETKRALSDMEMSRALQRLSDALDQLRYEFHTAKLPEKNPPKLPQ